MYCETCSNTGMLDCLCGGDLCVCGLDMYACPDCSDGMRDYEPEEAPNGE